MNTLNETLDKLTLSAHAIEFLERHGLDWDVEKVELFDSTGEPAPLFGIKRLDTGSIIGAVGPRYHPVQNSKTIEVIQRIADKADLDMAKAFVLDGGGKLAIQLRTQDYTGIGENNGTIEGYITVINSHDGSTGFRFGNSNTDIVCRNTFYRAYRGLGDQFSFRHNSSINRLVDEALVKIDTLRQTEAGIITNFKIMAQVEIDDYLISKAMESLVGFDRLAKDFDPDKYTPYQLNRYDDVMRCITEEMAYKGKTKWGLFSGVTKYTTHHIRAPKRENGRIESKIFGTANSWDNAAYALLS